MKIRSVLSWPHYCHSNQTQMQDGVAPGLSPSQGSHNSIYEKSLGKQTDCCAFSKQPHSPRTEEIQVPAPKVLLPCTPLLALPAAGKALNRGKGATIHWLLFRWHTVREQGHIRISQP